MSGPESSQHKRTPSPQIHIGFGDPFAPSPDGRAVFALDGSPRPDDNGVIVLYRVTLTANSEFQDVRLRVVIADAPTHPCYATPNVCGCECALTLVALEAVGGEFCVNPTATSCQVGADSATWSRVRTLLR